MTDHPAPISTARIDWQDSTPRSRTYDDSYWMPERGVRESWTVFIEANQLPQRFALLQADQQFVIGETGFGTGLNALLAARCFLEHAHQEARLDIFSVELHPLSRQDLISAHAHLHPMTDLLARLIDQYPPPVAGHHLIWLHPRVRLVLMLGHAEACWRDCPASVDAWFLDGFSPARNPDMWSETLMQTVSRRSNKGASFGTFTAAGHVRRALASAGFGVQRLPGFEGKRHRLVGQKPGQAPVLTTRRGHALVAGAGLAGCSSARALAERGWQVTVVDPSGIAAAASGNLAGVTHSSASAHMTPQNRFYQLALVHALAMFRRFGFPRREDDGRLNDVTQFVADPRMHKKLNQALAAGTWPDELLSRGDSESVVFHGSGFLRPDEWCRHLLDHPSIEIKHEQLLDFTSQDNTVLANTNRAEYVTDALILSVASSIRQLTAGQWLPLKMIRGQVSYVAATPASKHWEQAVCHAGYLTPALDGLHCVGATFDINDTSLEVRPEDDRTNLAQLRAHLPDHWQALGGDNIDIVGQRVGLRCQTPDFLPLAGPLPDPDPVPHRIIPAVYLNLAHGSRGLTHTPLCADLVADAASRMTPFLDRALIEALAPERFILRQRRRDPQWRPDCQ
jgi:tRNA 5-methylaminomethyl-2-thiouridine biosynthesis bifunctional protein